MGDDPANPSDPLQRPGDGTTPRTEDDELQDLRPFVRQGDTELTVDVRGYRGALLTVLAVTGRAEVEPSEPAPLALMVAEDADRADAARTLDAEQVSAARPAFVFVGPRLDADRADRVRFLLDGREVALERHPPFDLGTLRPGTHTITAQVDHDETTTTLSAEFSVWP